MSSEVTHHNGRELRGGCLRWIDPDGTEHVAWPHDIIYSTASVLAQFYWSERLRQWMPMESDDV